VQQNKPLWNLKIQLIAPVTGELVHQIRPPLLIHVLNKKHPCRSYSSQRTSLQSATSHTQPSYSQSKERKLTMQIVLEASFRHVLVGYEPLSSVTAVPDELYQVRVGQPTQSRHLRPEFALALRNEHVCQSQSRYLATNGSMINDRFFHHFQHCWNIGSDLHHTIRAACCRLLSQTAHSCPVKWALPVTAVCIYFEFGKLQQQVSPLFRVSPRGFPVFEYYATEQVPYCNNLSQANVWTTSTDTSTRLLPFIFYSCQ
jgi:hypothetical protein